MPSRLLFVTAALLLLAGCGGTTSTPHAPPKGWQTDNGRWWKQGVDTTRAFRDAESLKALGVTSGDKVFSASGADISTDQIVKAVKRELLPLYRNQPRIIDSLFAAHVRPKIEKQMNEQGAGGDVKKTIKELQQKGYQTLRNVFREPRSTTKLGDDVTVTYPDSLRRQGVGGQVQMQVFLNKEGKPRAVRLLKGVGHEVLDQGALRTVTQSRWRPAYVMRNGNWYAVPAWVRYSLNFTP